MKTTKNIMRIQIGITILAMIATTQAGSSDSVEKKRCTDCEYDFIRMPPGYPFIYQSAVTYMVFAL